MENYREIYHQVLTQLNNLLNPNILVLFTLTVQTGTNVYQEISPSCCIQLLSQLV